MVMAWVTAQDFARRSRRFVTNTNLTSLNRHIWQPSGSGRDVNLEEDIDRAQSSQANHKLLYPPSFETNYVWRKGGPSFLAVRLSEREEISMSTPSHDPSILKEFLEECGAKFLDKDGTRTVIYRSSCSITLTKPVWRRCMSRKARSLSTIFLAASVKESLIRDATDYLHPASRQW